MSTKFSKRHDRHDGQRHPKGKPQPPKPAHKFSKAVAALLGFFLVSAAFTGTSQANTITWTDLISRGMDTSTLVSTTCDGFTLFSQTTADRDFGTAQMSFTFGTFTLRTTGNDFDQTFAQRTGAWTERCDLETPFDFVITQTFDAPFTTTTSRYAA